MTRRIEALVALAALFCSVCLLACSVPDPVEQLQQARFAHSVELMDVSTWDSGHGEEGQDAEQPETSTVGIVAMRVSEEGSPLALDCLTVDVIFEGGTEEAPVEISRERVELNIEGIEDVGGSLDLTQRFDLPSGTVSVEFELADVPAEDLMTLCEAKAIRADHP